MEKGKGCKIKSFNPYYYWLVIFTKVGDKVYDFTKGWGFNPYYYWLVIFTNVRICTI